nr:copia protein [Tanacetum cinerariifolium]
TQSLVAEKTDISETGALRNFHLMYKMMTSDHNSSELRIHDHNNEQSSSKLVLRVVPLADKTATPPQVLELLFHHHITMLRKTTIVSEYRWTRDHPLEQVHGNPSRPVQTRRQLATDPKMCMYALTEEVYVVQPDRFVEPDHPEKVYRLRKALYGLKQALRSWYDELSKFLTSKGFTRGDKLVSWMSKKQNCTAISSAEAEYVALSARCAQVMWMRIKLQDYGFNYNKIPLYYDSQTEYQLEDMITKALPEDRFKYLVRRIGMRCLTPIELEVLAKESA